MAIIVNCDWLQYSVLTHYEQPEIECPKGYRIEVMTGNNVFRHRAIVSDERGRKWLTMLWSPYSGKLNSRLMTVQIANWLLYSGGIKTADRVLHQIVECKFNSMGRIDVCGDFQITDSQLVTIKHLNSGHYYVQGKKEGSAWWHNVGSVGTTAKAKQLHCLTWGSPSSKIKTKLYNKSREQGVLDGGEPEKPYIIEQWRLAGWDITKVYRLEFSLSSSGQLLWRGQRITLDDVASADWLYDVFSLLLEKRFVIRKNQGKRQGHKNLDEIVPFWSVPGQMVICSGDLVLVMIPTAVRRLKYYVDSLEDLTALL